MSMGDGMLVIHHGWAILATLVMAGVVTYLWVISRQHPSGEDHRASAHQLHCRIDDLHTRCTRQEEQMKSLPTHQDLHKVADAVYRIGGDVRNLQGQLGGISTSVGRMEKALGILTEHHIKEGRQ